MTFERFKTKADLPRFEPSANFINNNDHEERAGHYFSPRRDGFRNFYGIFNSTIKWYNSLPNKKRRLIERWVLIVLGVIGIWKLIIMRSSGSTEGVDSLGSSFKPSILNSYIGRKQIHRISSFDDNQVGIVEHYDLRKYQGSPEGWSKKEHVLICIPLRNAVSVIPMMISHLENLTYPHDLIDLAFLISDSDDSTDLDLALRLQKSSISSSYGKIEIFYKDFGAIIGQGFDDRHGVAVQGTRRKLMGRARNWLTAAALKPYHSWVYWRDADIETAPTTIIEDLMKHGRDVIVPNVWRPLPDWLGNEQPYDLNSWQESDPALELAKTLNEDDVIVEGYAEYPTWRAHLAYFRDVDGNPNDMFDLDGIGGVSILARAKVFRQGAMFPGFALWNHAETEGFGKMCRKMGFTVSGLPHYTIWHVYEPSEDDLKKMKEMDAEGSAKTEKVNSVSS